MSAFDIHRSLERAAERFFRAPKRSDAGRSRLDPRVEAELGELLGGADRPKPAAVVAELRARCQRHGWPVPSRAASYQAVHRFIAAGELPGIPARALPAHVRATLHNVADDAVIPGDQVVFHVFNVATGAALSYAAGMPWLHLRRAEQRRGWRPKSLALLRAVLRFRGC